MINKLFEVAGILVIIGFILLVRYVRNHNKKLNRDCSIKINFDLRDYKEADRIMRFIMNNQNVISAETNLMGIKVQGFLEVIEGTEMSVYRWVKRKIPDNNISSIEVMKNDRTIVFVNRNDVCQIKYRAVN